MTHNEIITIIEAHKVGEEIEVYNVVSKQWETVNGNLDYLLLFIGGANPWEIRLKSIPKFRPMDSEEFPPLWWFKHPCESNNWKLVTYQNKEIFRVINHRNHLHELDFKFSEAIAAWKWSPDRKIIKSFFAESKV